MLSLFFSCIYISIPYKIDVKTTNNIEDFLKQSLHFFKNLNYIIFSIPQNETLLLPHQMDKSYVVCNSLNPEMFAMDGEKGFIILETNPLKIRKTINNISLIAQQYTKILIISNSHDVASEYVALVSDYNLTNTILHLIDSKHIVAYSIYKKSLKLFKLEELDEIEKFLNDNNLHGFQIASTLFDSIPTSFMVNGKRRGVDFKTLTAISEKLNLSIEYHVPNDLDWFGNRYSNGTTTGALGELYKRTSQIAFCQMFVKNYETPELDFSRVVYSDRLCVIVAKIENYSQWIFLLESMSTGAFICVFAALFASIVVIYFIRKLNNLKNNNKYNAGFINVTFDVFQMFFNTSRSQIISENYYERLFMGLFLLFVLINNTSFQSALAMSTTRPSVPAQIDTLQALASSPHQIITYSSNLKDTFRGSNISYMITLNEQLSVLSTQLNQTSKNHAFLSRETKFQYTKILDFKTDFHLVKECPSNFLLAYMFRKDFCLKKKFNKILGRLHEGGLLKKWSSDVIIQATIKNSANNTIKLINNNNSKAFSVIDLGIPFSILIFGFALSCIIFSTELILNLPLLSNFKFI